MEEGTGRVKMAGAMLIFNTERRTKITSPNPLAGTMGQVESTYIVQEGCHCFLTCMEVLIAMYNLANVMEYGLVT